MKKEFTNKETEAVFSAFNYQPYDFILEQTEEDEEEEDFEPGTQESQFLEPRIQKFAKRIKDGFIQHKPALGGVYGDLLTAALDNVIWHEVADRFISDTQDLESSIQDDTVLDLDIIE